MTDRRNIRQITYAMLSTERPAYLDPRGLSNTTTSYIRLIICDVSFISKVELVHQPNITGSVESARNKIALFIKKAVYF